MSLVASKRASVANLSKIGSLEIATDCVSELLCKNKNERANQRHFICTASNSIQTDLPHGDIALQYKITANGE